MKTTIRTTPYVLVGLVLSASIVWAHAKKQHKVEAPAHSHEMSEVHGGKVTMTDEFHFEVAFARDGVRVYGYDAAQHPISVEGVSGRLTIEFRDGDRKPIEVILEYASPPGMPEHNDHGHASAELGYLLGVVDLAELEEGAAKATFELADLPGQKEKKVRFKESFELARLVAYVCPMGDADPAGEAGSCPKCGMDLVATRYVYACPDHPGVTSHDAKAKCWLDGKTLEMSVVGAKKPHDTHSGHDHGHH